MARLVATTILILLGAPAAGQQGFVVAQFDAVGPCSPYHADDGDIPSELPGCARRRSPVPGSLSDELQFRRHRHRSGEEEWDPGALDDGPLPRRQRSR